MKFALLGCDEEVLEIAREIAANSTHQIVAAFEADAWRGKLNSLAPWAAWDDKWETLLLGNLADGVIVSGSDTSDARADQLRKLVQAAVPLVLVHPSCEAIIALELDMVRRDTRCVMASHSPGRLHPAFLRLSEWARQGETSPVGIVEQIVFERTLDSRDRTVVIKQFARDAEMLRTLLGNINKVNATGMASGTTLTSISVHVANQESVSARWSLEPVTAAMEGKLALFGSKGKATLHMPAAPASWRIEGIDDDAAAPLPAEWNDARATIDQWAAALQGASPQPVWGEICRTLEVVDATERSLTRGRAIELQQTVVSEQDTFKGMMAAGGCLLLMAALMVIFFSSLVEGIRLAGHPEPPGSSVRAKGDSNKTESSPATDARNRGGQVFSPLRYWPVCLLTPLVLFLLLQFLQLVFQPPKGKPSDEITLED